MPLMQPRQKDLNNTKAKLEPAKSAFFFSPTTFLISPPHLTPLPHLPPLDPLMRHRKKGESERDKEAYTSVRFNAASALVSHGVHHQ